MMSALILTTALLGQVRAPAGGAYGSNGQFYKGGQFMPGGGGYGYSPSNADFLGLIGGYGPSRGYVPVMPAPRARPRAKLRQADVSGPPRGPAADANRAIGTALSRLDMARNLAAAGKREDARGWLDRVVEMDASPETVARARAMLASLDPRRHPAGRSDAADDPRRGVSGNAILEGIGARR